MAFLAWPENCRKGSGKDMGEFDNASAPVIPCMNRVSSNLLSLRERVRQAARQLECEIIIETLEQHRWNRRHAEESLKISYRSLMYKMKSCNLRNDPPASRVDNGSR